MEHYVYNELILIDYTQCFLYTEFPRRKLRPEILGRWFIRKEIVFPGKTVYSGREDLEREEGQVKLVVLSSTHHITQCSTQICEVQTSSIMPIRH